MTRFQDGPAKGQALMLKRAVKFLRVVCEYGKWDALDQPDDKPKQLEAVFAYQIAEFRGMSHVNCGRGKGSGFYPIVDYKFCPVQPTDQQMRDDAAWDAWCKTQPDPMPDK